MPGQWLRPAVSPCQRPNICPIVELTDSIGRPCSLQQNVTAELQPSQPTPNSQATPTSTGWWPWSKKLAPTTDQLPAISAAVAMISPSQYEVSYTAVSRGQHKLHIRVNGRETNSSPFTMTVYPDPTQLGHAVRVVWRAQSIRHCLQQLRGNDCE